MGTWICHLRIVENLLITLPHLDETAFTFGNLAPDSGIPNADWTQFDPPKEVTHFQSASEDEGGIRDLGFFHEHLAQLTPQNDLPRYSFALGYFFHLVCDKLWAKHIGTTSKHAYAALFAEHGKNAAVELIKTDWYGLDHRYVRDHPTSLFWRVLMCTPNPPAYLSFIPLAALHQQLDYIRAYYSQPDGTRVLDRAYPFLNETTMSRFIADTTASLLVIYARLPDLCALHDTTTALALLTDRDIAPYDPPLGDVA